MRLRHFIAILVALGISSLFTTTAQAADSGIPDMGTIRDIVSEVLKEGNADHNDHDLIDQGQVQTVLKALADQEEWDVPDAPELMKQVLPNSHALVRTLRTPAGRRFMRKVRQYKLIYDRLDRVSRVAGGPALLKALIKLPDAERYAHFSTRREVPDLIDFLPKERNGKTRKIPDYTKPTNRVYTAKHLIDRLKISRDVAIRESKGKKK